MKAVKPRRALILLLLLSSLSLVVNQVYGAYEDFTTYTEQDESAVISVNATDVYGVFTRKEYAYVYKDFGNDYFDDFTHFFDAYLNFTLGASGLAVIWMVLIGNSKPADPGADWYDLRSGGYSTLSVDFLRTVDYYQARLGYYNGASFTKNETNISLDTWYYFNITRSGTFLELQIYSTKSDRDNNSGNNLVSKTSLTVTTNTGRYLYSASSYDNNLNAGSRWITARIKNYDLSPVKPQVYLTMYQNTGGSFRRDNATVANGTVLNYDNATLVSLELIALVLGNNTYTFSNWTYDTSYNYSNPFNFNETLIQNMTVWCYFEVPSADGVDVVGEPKLFVGAVVFGLFVSLPIIILYGKKR